LKIDAMHTIPDDLGNRLRHHGQEHVLAGWDRLTSDERQHLVRQLEAIDLDELRRLHERRTQRSAKIDPARIAPLPREDLSGQRRELQARGEEAYRAGQVAMLVVAGGQGTRLGFDRAKGLYPVGPITGKTLFQWHAEKVLALGRRFGRSIPLMVMTSPATDAETRQFFADQRYFNLLESDVWFFCQGTMPALDWESGRLLLEAPGKLFLSPNGHGGTLTALADTGLLDRLESASIRTVYYFQIDNPLVNLADFLFVGRHREADAQVSTKVLPKASPKEPVGNVVLFDGKCAIIEYSDLDDSLLQLTDERGEPHLWAANPAIHLFDVAFLRKMTRNAESMPWHIAHKKVPHVDEQGRQVSPTANNALKAERFIFDVLPLAERWTIMPTTREQEFAPLKNAQGADSPATVRAALIGQAADWLLSVGVSVPRDAEGQPAVELEVSPLYALDADELARKIDRGLRVDRAMVLG
jgi:UDP-N-acetylglucosamine/UDP-N-acetylgalactosamine diphosphorylase